MKTKDSKKLKVLALNPLDDWSYHFWFGIQCGYPLCCILWYCDSILEHGSQWWGLFEKVYRSELMDNPKWMPTIESVKKDSDHNECPECLLKRLTGLTKS